MGHHTLRSSWQKLVDRINKMPQGAPESEALYKILEILVTREEAELLAKTPLAPFTAKRAARIWKMPVDRAHRILDGLAGRSMLVDMKIMGEVRYVLPPPMAGFFEFSMMRLRDDVDQKALAELFWEYLNEDDAFLRELFLGGETRPGRAFVNEEARFSDDTLQILDWERASEVARTAKHIAVGMCYCRHKMEHLGKACDAPMDICLTFNTPAASLIRHGNARRIDTAECLEIFSRAKEAKLVQMGENSQKQVTFICNCCGCCCEALLAHKRFGTLKAIQTTGFVPELTNPESCKGCGKCVKVCPVDAITLVSAEDPARPKRKRSKIDEELCIGCGLCTNECEKEALAMKRRDEIVIPPLTPVHRTVVSAIEKGKLQELILDNNVMLDRRALGYFLEVIFSLEPVKRNLANKMLQSRFLDAVGSARLPEPLKKLLKTISIKS